MAELGKDPPIIRIVKKRGHGGRHHGGAWKVAFADFVTAMMALFIVLWILGQSEDMKRGVGGYFRDPMGAALLGRGDMEADGKERILGPMLITTPTIFKRMTAKQRNLEAEADRLKKMLEDTEGLTELKDQISVEITKEGIRIEIAEADDEAIFESGSSNLTPKLIRALEVLAKEYAKLPAPVVIEGHTDSVPYSGFSGMSNWELSTQRANEARKVLLGAGLQEEKIFMIRGYADRQPITDNPEDAKNRRISMLLLSSQGLEMNLGTLSIDDVNRANGTRISEPEVTTEGNVETHASPKPITVATRGGH
jgi:chemotaxis protein MotB